MSGWQFGDELLLPQARGRFSVGWKRYVPLTKDVIMEASSNVTRCRSLVFVHPSLGNLWFDGLYGLAGGTVMAVLEDISRRGAQPQNIRVIAIVAAPPALKQMSEKYPGSGTEELLCCAIF